MNRKTVLLLITPLILLTGSTQGTADPLKEELERLKARIEQIEKKLEAQTTKNTQQDDKLHLQEAALANQATIVDDLTSISRAIGNLEFSIGATSVLQGTINNDRNHHKTPGIDEKGDDTDASYSVDVEIGAKIGTNGRAFLHLEAGEGEGLNAEAAGLTGVNADALGDSVDFEVAELWYEHSFMAGRIIATVGKLDPVVYFDANAVANDENIQFLSDQFVNNIAVDFPDYSYGIRLSCLPAAWMEINLGVLEADGDYEDIFDDNFFIAEIVLKPEFGDRSGNYRIYAWRNSGEHEKLRDTLRDDKSGDGIGLSFDQQLSQHMTAFCRYGQQSSDIYEVDRAWSAGFQITGGLWGREKDLFGIAYGAAAISSAYRDVLRNEGFSTTAAESRIEAYYRFWVNDHLSLSPDIQWLDGLGGTHSADTVSIFGLRAHLDF